MYVMKKISIKNAAYITGAVVGGLALLKLLQGKESSPVEAVKESVEEVISVPKKVIKKVVSIPKKVFKEVKFTLKNML